MKIDVVTIAYNLPQATEQLIKSAVSDRHKVEYHLFMHSIRPEITQICWQMAEHVIGMRMYPYGVNRGLSKSWNEGMLAAYEGGADVVVIVNDDCKFSPGDLDRLAEKAVESRDKYMVSAFGFNHRLNCMTNLGFSCFVINPIGMEKIGCFDENFFPIYFEDCDYDRRAKLLGLDDGWCSDTNVEHGGSMAIHSDQALMNQNHTTFTANRDYYIRKWSGQPRQEIYSTPFGEDVPLRIDPAEREHPYGVFDRKDQEIVKI